MRNKYFIFSGIFSLILLSSCENFLDKDPLDKFSENAIWSNKELVEANLADLYSSMPFFDADNGGNAHRVTFLGGELYLHNGPNSWITGVLSEKGGIMEHWAYGHIYLLNTFIQKVESSPLDKNMIEIRKAEARFLRAFQYFEMVKRYGGVPIITEPQSINDGDKLYVKRNSEKEVYDFIEQECDEIEQILPEVADQYGRVTKYTVLALKSRAMLYAASIAQFGEEQLDGLLGFPKSDAQVYYKKSYEASKKIIDSGKFSLYSKEVNKVLNFQNLFLDEKNSECIFSKVYNGKNKVGHSYDHWFFPEFLSKDYGGMGCPYLDIVQEFEYIDGREGTLDLDKLTSELVDFKELFKDKDPRFHASILWPESLFKGQKFLSHSGTYINGSLDITTNEVGEYDGQKWFAKSTSYKSLFTGFSVKKYVDELVAEQPLPGESDTDYMVYRYGETLLNIAEAAFELGKEEEALRYINMIRERAGIKLRNNITRDMIRHERNVELAFEGHRYWDLRRWRTALDELSIEKKGIEIYMDWETKKYKVSLKKADPVVRGFSEKMYYFPITVTRISNNPNLAPENPGY